MRAGYSRSLTTVPIAEQFSTTGAQFEDAEAPDPWSIDGPAHERAPVAWRNFTPFPIRQASRSRTSNLFEGQRSSGMNLR
jgi:hypothetical protein